MVVSRIEKCRRSEHGRRFSRRSCHDRVSSQTSPSSRPQGHCAVAVVSLLTLFVLIGVTYAVVASVYRDTAKIQAGRQLVGDPPEREIENVLYVLLRDSLVKGPFQYHSLLYDLYGDDGSKEVLAADAVEENGGQVWKLQLTTRPIAATAATVRPRAQRFRTTTTRVSP